MKMFPLETFRNFNFVEIVSMHLNFAPIPHPSPHPICYAQARKKFLVFDIQYIHSNEAELDPYRAEPFHEIVQVASN